MKVTSDKYHKDLTFLEPIADDSTLNRALEAARKLFESPSGARIEDTTELLTGFCTLMRSAPEFYSTVATCADPDAEKISKRTMAQIQGDYSLQWLCATMYIAGQVAADLRARDGEDLPKARDYERILLRDLEPQAYEHHRQKPDAETRRLMEKARILVESAAVA
jgi:hypothetical protein